MTAMAAGVSSLFIGLSLSSTIIREALGPRQAGLSVKDEGVRSDPEEGRTASVGRRPV
jgi:hypothetical protein